LVVGDGTAGNGTVREVQGNQIADAKDVLVNSDGTFDLNGLTDTVNNLTVTGGTVTTGADGQPTTAAVDLTGGQINVGASGKLTSTSVQMRGGAAINGAAGATVSAAQVTVDASTIAFATNGHLNTTGSLSLDHASTLSAGNGSVIAVGTAPGAA